MGFENDWVLSMRSDKGMALSEQYTPTTDEVRAAYFVRKTGLLVSAMTHYPEFDRWLAERDAEVAAKAWEEGRLAEELAWEHAYNGHPVPEGDTCDECAVVNPYRKGTNE